MQNKKLLNTGTLMMLALAVFVLAATISGCLRDTERSEHERDSHESENEESGTTLTLNETYDMVRNGVRLTLSYDAQSNSFKGTVENITDDTLNQVRVEVHLSNGIELGPTIPVDLTPHKKVDIIIPATNQGFNEWATHAEVSGEDT